MTNPRERPDLDSMMRDPADWFASPMDVVKDPQLARDGKKRILESWARDAELLSQAEAENMPGGEERTRLQEVHLALLELQKQK